MHRVGRRCEQNLLANRDTEALAEEWSTDNIPPPGPMITVGLDGGYIRSRDAPSRHEGCFEVSLTTKYPNSKLSTGNRYVWHVLANTLCYSGGRPASSFKAP